MGRTIAKRVSFMTEDDGRVSYNPGDEVAEEHMKYLQAERLWEGAEDLEKEAKDESGLPYDEMSYRKLLEVAKDLDIEFHSNPKKAEVLEAILEATSKDSPDDNLQVEDEEEELLEEEAE